MKVACCLWFFLKELGTILRTDRVDLVVLDFAPIELRYAVIATGSVVYQIERKTRVEFEALTLGLYGDYLHHVYLKVFTQKMVEKIIKHSANKKKKDEII